MLKIGSHVGMKGKEMMLGSAKEAHSYGANTYMIFTGAPQNTKRKPIAELNIEAAWEFMKTHDISEPIIHAPYIINLGNSTNEETFRLAVDFLAMDMERTAAMGCHTLVLHPGSHVGAGADAGIRQIAQGLNEILSADTPCCIALETMAGKGSEIGRNFEELAAIFDKVVHNDKLRICLDTCHMHDTILTVSSISWISSSAKTRWLLSTSTTAKIPAGREKTDMLTSAWVISDLMPCTPSCIIPLSPESQEYWRPPICPLKATLPNLFLLIRMKSRG